MFIHSLFWGFSWVSIIQSFNKRICFLKVRFNILWIFFVFQSSNHGFRHKLNLFQRLLFKSGMQFLNEFYIDVLLNVPNFIFLLSYLSFSLWNLAFSLLLLLFVFLYCKIQTLHFKVEVLLLLFHLINPPFLLFDSLRHVPDHIFHLFLLLSHKITFFLLSLLYLVTLSIHAFN